MRSFSKTRARAKTLRREMTPPEVMLWIRLRSRQDGGPRIRRQHPIGPYIADFYCSEAQLVIEIDGWGHNMGDQGERDERRDAWMEARGLSILRYPADAVMRDPNGVADGIWDTCMDLMRRRGARSAPSVSSPIGADPPPPRRG
jgi:very-short-patch-repair endonuclease